MERKKQYKRKWISAKRQLNRLAPELSETVDNELTDYEPNEDTAYANSEAKSSPTTLSHCENKAEMGSLSPDGNCSVLSSESVEYDCADEHLNDTELRYKLGEWATENQVKNNAVDKLLKILQEAGHHVPATAEKWSCYMAHLLFSHTL